MCMGPPCHVAHSKSEIMGYPPLIGLKFPGIFEENVSSTARVWGPLSYVTSSSFGQLIGLGYPSIFEENISTTVGICF